VALIVIAIICVIASCFIKLVPMPAPVPTVIWCIVAVICLLILLRVVTGGSLGISL
jgi:hypothetical protein